MSSNFTDHFLLHVSLTTEAKITSALEEIRRLAFTMYDRDVQIDLSCIQRLNDEQKFILKTIEALLEEAGHKLVICNKNNHGSYCHSSLILDSDASYSSI